MTERESTPFFEQYGRLEDHDRCFDVAYWQEQGAAAIFQAAYDLIRDYYVLKCGYADEPEFQRTVEYFQ